MKTTSFVAAALLAVGSDAARFVSALVLRRTAMSQHVAIPSSCFPAVEMSCDGR